VSDEDEKIEGLGKILARLEINTAKTHRISSRITKSNDTIPLENPTSFQQEIWKYLVRWISEYF